MLRTNIDVIGNTLVTYSVLSTPRPGVGNIVVDPLFENPSSGNYRLQTGSPAIDAGRNTASSFYGSVIADHDNMSRPQDGDSQGAGGTGDGSDYDIGAYEYLNQ